MAILKDRAHHKTPKIILNYWVVNIYQVQENGDVKVSIDGYVDADDRKKHRAVERAYYDIPAEVGVFDYERLSIEKLNPHQKAYEYIMAFADFKGGVDDRDQQSIEEN